jgi:hypothetical protein
VKVQLNFVEINVLHNCKEWSIIFIVMINAKKLSFEPSSNEGARVYGDAVRLKVMCLGYFSISKFVACEN